MGSFALVNLTLLLGAAAIAAGVAKFLGWM